jgi:hypothetical protein
VTRAQFDEIVAQLDQRRRKRGARNADYRYPGATPVIKQNGLPEGKPLIYLVAGEGFEPSTFGL